MVQWIKNTQHNNNHTVPQNLDYLLRGEIQLFYFIQFLEYQISSYLRPHGLPARVKSDRYWKNHGVPSRELVVNICKTKKQHCSSACVCTWLPASISPPLLLSTCQRNEIPTGIETCCQGSVPAVAMYLQLQTIVNVSQKFHSKHVHWPFGDNGNQPLSSIRRNWSLSKQIVGRGWLVWISDSLVNIAFLDLVICPNCTLQFYSRWKRTHLSAQRFALSTRLIWTKREKFKKRGLSSRYIRALAPKNQYFAGPVQKKKCYART